MNTGVRVEIDRYVKNAFAAAQQAANVETLAEISKTNAGTTCSGRAMDYELVHIHVAKIKKLLHARADAQLDAHELVGAPIDEKFILRDLDWLRVRLISRTSKTVQNLGTLRAIRNNRHDPGAGMWTAEFRRQLTIQTQAVSGEVLCQIARRRVMPKITKQYAGVSIVYHLHDNSRINVQSTDQSANTVTVTQEQLFTNIRNAIREQIPAVDQHMILQRLTELEKARGTPTFVEHYTAFIGAAANHVTIISPFIPALTELLSKAFRT